MDKFSIIILFGIVSFFYNPGQKNKLDQKLIPNLETNSAKKIGIPGSVIVVENFLNWYKLNYEELSNMQLVDNFGKEPDSTKFYRVNFTATEAYLNKLISSGYISSDYVKQGQLYFTKKDEYLKKHPQFQGTPLGFEFDYVLQSPQIMVTLESIENLIISEVEEGKSESFVEVNIAIRLSFHLTKYANIWMIDDIQNLGY